jgi:hypothetical protein
MSAMTALRSLPDRLEGRRLGEHADVEKATISFVIRSPVPIPTESQVQAVHAVRRAFRNTPEFDTRLQMVSCPDPGASVCVRPAAVAVATAVKAVRGLQPWVGVVRTHQMSPQDAATVAERWIDLARRLVSPRVVERSDVAFMQRLLEDRPWATTLASLLDPVAEHDRRQKTSILRTLDVALLDVPEYRNVAELLEIDRHTVTRHLNAAGTILGRDIRWGIDRMLVEQALLARRALHGARGGSLRGTGPPAAGYDTRRRT